MIPDGEYMRMTVEVYRCRVYDLISDEYLERHTVLISRLPPEYDHIFIRVYQDRVEFEDMTLH